MSGIYIPGKGEMTWEQIKIDRAVREYDERLFFGRNTDTGDWCVFITLPRPRDPYPVIGFGHELPHVSKVLENLTRGDTLRNGNAIYDEIVKSQQDYKKTVQRQGDEAAGETSEVVEHFMRRHGKSPVIKEFIGHDIPKGGDASDA